MEDNPIPTRLKQARKHAKITQKNLGIMIGMDESSASRMNHYEKGRHTPDISTLRKMADALGVPLNYFFCEDEASAELATAISRLSEDKRNQVLNFVKSLEESDE
ncbi:helix-turn-helix domain-containing protein [Vibrio nigripulchritudo]|uniref:helix-turn-helix domain-containing protein n=1 Tax=Vibrio nigripulchritudo TaxID=28173 RepID=UPI002493AB98|nr:helix-turn-helix domain-containing protein [Vibrio nigripulchritudo]BDU42217.1 transcriptional regulator [Vibrio nigripulchritudo]